MELYSQLKETPIYNIIILAANPQHKHVYT